MKKVKYILFFVLLVTVGACDSLLDVEPKSTLTYNGFWESVEAAEAAHTGLYAFFRDYHYTFWGLGELRGGIWGGPTVETPFYLDFTKQNINPTNVPYADWGGFYSLIYRINDFLANIDKITFQDKAAKQHMIGEAYGMRAFVYYTMLKTWGGVPIVTEPIREVNPKKFDKPRSTPKEVMVFIKKDIERSLQAFGSDNSFWKGKRIYWSKAATLVLKGDVYIWSGNLMGGGTADFNEAKQALLKVTNMDFGLAPNYADLWGAKNEVNKEFIFVIDYTQDEAENFYNLMVGRATEINQTWNAEGESMADFIANGANRFGPRKDILQAMSGPVDTRGNATWIKLYTNDDGHIPFDTNGYQTSILKKFLGPVVAGSRQNVNDVPIYRYADVLLLLAQAKNLLGEDPSSYINMIRKRAYGQNWDPSKHAYNGGTQTQNAWTILQERLKEFIGEGKRWWALRRAGNSFVFEALEFLDPSEAYKLLLPITPDMRLDNPALDQTPGY